MFLKPRKSLFSKFVLLVVLIIYLFPHPQADSRNGVELLGMGPTPGDVTVLEGRDYTEVCPS